jgi:subtilisin family serine protease
MDMEIQNRFSKIVSILILSVHIWPFIFPITSVAKESKDRFGFNGKEFRLSIEDNLISLDSVGGDLRGILNEMSGKTGIQIELNQKSDGPITVSFNRLPVVDAIQKLVENVAMVYSRNQDGSFQLSKVVITDSTENNNTRYPLSADTPIHDGELSLPFPSPDNYSEHIDSASLTKNIEKKSQPGIVPNELIIHFREEISKEEINRSVKEAGAVIKSQIEPLNVFVLSLPPDIPTNQALKWFTKHSAVEGAEPNYLIPVQTAPNDPLFPSQWSLHNTGQKGGTIAADVDVVAAWDRVKGRSDVVIAIVDTGVDYKHEDLAPNIWHNPGEIPDNGIDDDHNGFIDDVIGWDFVNGVFGVQDEDFSVSDNDPMDRHGHGTQVAGISAAAGNNQQGIIGVAWNCRLMVVRTGYKTASGNGMMQSDYVAQGIIYAAQNGAHIINISWGSSQPSRVIKHAIDFATDHGALVCAAAGNQNTTTPFYPAAFDNMGIISVGATDHNDQRALFSNYGSWVDVYAPGTFILTTYPSNGYVTATGTSFATALVSGIAGLVASLNTEMSSVEIKAAILASADSIVPLAVQSISTQNPGRVNAKSALNHSGVSAFVTRFYQQCLDRNPDTPGLNGWVLALSNGALYGADVANGFIFSQEFINRNTSNEEFVTILYRAFFDREPDTGGYDDWVNYINSGASRQEVLNGFIYSIEFENLCKSYGIAPYSA